MPLVFLRTAVAAVALGSLAWAGQTCVSASVPLTTTNWTQSVSLPRFDSSLGVLTAVHVQLGAHIEGTAAIENFEPVAIAPTLHFSAQVTVTRPDTSILLLGAPGVDIWPVLAPHDGTLDFGGTSGATYPGLVVDALPSPFVTLASPADLALFTGPTLNPGSIALGVSASGTSTAIGSGPLVTQFSTQASALITICFDYGPAVTSYCVGTNAACPCANGVFYVAGCRNSGLVGAGLVPSGVASLFADSFVLASTNLPAGASTLFFQGTARVNGGNGSIFGDGLLCAGGTVTRLGVKTASAGSASYPAPGDAPISQAGLVPPGAVRTYQSWYRDAAVFCTSDTFNLSQGLEVTWGQ